MSLVLKTDELLEIIKEVSPADAAQLQAELENLTNRMASIVAHKLQVSAGIASFEGVAFAGTAVPFSPGKRGQSCPEILKRYDPGGDWECVNHPSLPASPPTR